MTTRQFSHGRRSVLCLGVMGFLGLVSGCSDSNPVDAVSPEEGKKKGQAQQEAREKQYGKGGIPKTEKAKKN
jgi:hypothetical protein